MAQISAPPTGNAALLSPLLIRGRHHVFRRHRTRRPLARCGHLLHPAASSSFTWRGICDNARAAFWTVVLFIIVPMYAWKLSFMTEAAASIGLMALAMFAFSLAIEKDRGWWWLLGGGACGLALLVALPNAWWVVGLVILFCRATRPGVNGCAKAGSGRPWVFTLHLPGPADLVVEGTAGGRCGPHPASSARGLCPTAFRSTRDSISSDWKFFISARSFSSYSSWCCGAWAGTSLA